MTQYPMGYGHDLVSMAALRARHEPRMHPEYARRLFAWIEAQGGHIGIGGGWRMTQPDRPGFAPDGRSFHQTQTFSGGFQGYCAVDLVARNGTGIHRSPTWTEVPQQGGAEAARWGVHCNIGTPAQTWPNAEPWHMQPIEIDGWATWKAQGSPDLRANYPLPVNPPTPVPPPTKDDDPMFITKHTDGSHHIGDGRLRTYVADAAGLIAGYVRAGAPLYDWGTGEAVKSTADVTKANVNYLGLDPTKFGPRSYEAK